VAFSLDAAVFEHLGIIDGIEIAKPTPLTGRNAVSGAGSGHPQGLCRGSLVAQGW